MTAPCFETRGLTKVYGDGPSAVHALRGVDLIVPEGEFVVLLGASGSGKSTLLNILGGLDVARRAVSPRMRLAPGWIEVPVHLSDGGRVALGGELSLMPGTLAAGARRGRLLVHLLDTEAGFDRAIPREEGAIAAMMLDDGRPGRAS